MSEDTTTGQPVINPAADSNADEPDKDVAVPAETGGDAVDGMMPKVDKPEGEEVDGEKPADPTAAL